MKSFASGKVKLQGAAFLLVLTFANPCVSQTAPKEYGRPSLGARFIHELLLPVGSVFIPGLGQWGNGSVEDGFAYLIVSTSGLLLAGTGEEDPHSTSDLPRTANEQKNDLGLQLAFNTGLLSGYDSFRRSLPRMKGGGRYAFLDEPTSVGAALAAPVKFGYLKNKRTWLLLTIPLALVTAVAIDERGTEKLPFGAHDALYAAGVSYGAGVTEEAYFRGYLYPMFNQWYGERVWLANSTQALLFSLAHLGAIDIPWPQLLIGFYWGWVTEKDDWDIQETIFQHFWWDMIVITGALLLDDGGESTLFVELPAIRF